MLKKSSFLLIKNKTFLHKNNINLKGNEKTTILTVTLMTFYQKYLSVKK